MQGIVVNTFYDFNTFTSPSIGELIENIQEQKISLNLSKILSGERFNMSALSQNTQSP